MLDCTAADIVKQRPLPLDNGDMHKEASECLKKSTSSTEVVVVVSTVAAADTLTQDVGGGGGIAVVPSVCDRPKIDRSPKFFHVAGSAAAAAAAELSTALAVSRSRSQFKMAGRQERDEEMELYTRSLTSTTDRTISSQTTDEEYRVVPRWSSQVHRAGSRYTLVPAGAAPETSDEEMTVSDGVGTTVSRELALTGGVCSPSIQLLAASDAFLADGQRVKPRIASYPELNTLQEMAFIEWNVMQNDMLAAATAAPMCCTHSSSS